MVDAGFRFSCSRAEHRRGGGLSKSPFLSAVVRPRASASRILYATVTRMRSFRSQRQPVESGAFFKRFLETVEVVRMGEY